MDRPHLKQATIIRKKKNSPIKCIKLISMGKSIWRHAERQVNRDIMQHATE